MKLDLLTNASVVDDAIRFVYDWSKDKQKSSDNSNEDDKEETNELDYKGDDQLEEEQEDERIEATNQVF